MREGSREGIRHKVVLLLKRARFPFFRSSVRLLLQMSSRELTTQTIRVQLVSAAGRENRISRTMPGSATQWSRIAFLPLISSSRGTIQCCTVSPGDWYLPFRPPNAFSTKESRMLMTDLRASLHVFLTALNRCGEICNSRYYLGYKGILSIVHS